MNVASKKSGASSKDLRRVRERLAEMLMPLAAEQGVQARTIKEVVELLRSEGFRVTPAMLRQYESGGDTLLAPGRSENRYRQYDHHSVDRLRDILVLLQLGYSRKWIKAHLDLRDACWKEVAELINLGKPIYAAGTARIRQVLQALSNDRIKKAWSQALPVWSSYVAQMEEVERELGRQIPVYEATARRWTGDKVRGLWAGEKAAHMRKVLRK